MLITSIARFLGNVPSVNVKDYGAVCDFVQIGPCVTTTGNPVVTCSAGQFTQADVGKTWTLRNASASGRGSTTILSVQSATQVTLASSAGLANDSTAICGYGTDNYTAFNNAFAAAQATGGLRAVYIPGSVGVSPYNVNYGPGNSYAETLTGQIQYGYLFTKAPLIAQCNALTIYGDGPRASRLYCTSTFDYNNRKGLIDIQGSSTGIQMYGLGFDGCMATQTNTGTANGGQAYAVRFQAGSMWNCEIWGWGASGGLFVTGNDVHIDDCTIKQCKVTNIFVSNVTTGMMTRCVTQSNGAYPMTPNGQIVADTLGDFTFAYCNFDEAIQGGAGGFDYDIGTGCTRVNFVACLIYGMTSHTVLRVQSGTCILTGCRLLPFGGNTDTSCLSISSGAVIISNGSYLKSVGTGKTATGAGTLIFNGLAAELIGVVDVTTLVDNSLVTRTMVPADVTNATTTFAAITGMTFAARAGYKYVGKLIMKANNTVAGEGIKIDFAGGTATMTSFWASLEQLLGGTAVLGTGISTSLSGVMNYTTITGETILEANVSFVCSGTGTVIPRQAENSHVTGTLTVELGSWMEVFQSA